MTDVTRILSQIDHGDSNAADQLLTLGLGARGVSEIGRPKMRFFCGMTIDETAGSLGISHATVERHWALRTRALTRGVGG